MRLCLHLPGMEMRYVYDLQSLAYAGVAQAAAGPEVAAAATGAASAKARGSDGDMLTIVTSQRDRFRRRCTCHLLFHLSCWLNSLHCIQMTQSEQACNEVMTNAAFEAAVTLVRAAVRQRGGVNLMHMSRAVRT